MCLKNAFCILLYVVALGECSKYTFVKSDDDFGFASYLQSNMVLQRAPNSAVLWGYGTIGASVTVTVDGVDYVSAVKLGHDEKGNWNVTLKPHKQGGPFTITAVQDKPVAKAMIDNVMFGDVWFCSGQSNMQFSMQQILNASYELDQVKNYPNIRIFYAAMETSNVTLYDLKGIRTPWSVPTHANVNGFSAVCWLYGKYLYNKLKMPIGLVHSAWGGTPIETWSPYDALKDCGLNKEYDPADLETPSIPLPKYNSIAPNPNPQNNSLLWNSMVSPFLNMTIKGVIWYQGEQNAYYHRDAYGCSFPTMIHYWRQKWFEGTGGQTEPVFPFGFVQLCVRNEPTWMDDGYYSTIRWHQTADIGYVSNYKMPNTFMAVTIDLPDSGIPFNSPHTRDKEDVSMRLANGALNLVYGYDVPAVGPTPELIYQRSITELEVAYSNSQNLVLTSTENFQVCCDPDVCPESEAYNGPTWHNTTVSSWDLHSLRVNITVCMKQHVNAVRYAWTVTPCPFKKCQVYNDKGLPAPPYIFHC